MTTLRVDTLLEGFEYRDDPFPYLVNKNALPEKVYRVLCKTRPADEAFGPMESNTRRDAHTRDIRGQGLWKDFIDYYTGPEFYRRVLEVFGPAIHRIYGKVLETDSVGVRETGDFDISTECQIGVNSPCAERSRVIGPHLDNPKELYAGLLYMPVEGDPGGGDFEIRKLTRAPRFYGKMRIDDDCTEIVETVKYEPNVFVMFINSPISVHSVSERGPCKEYRRLVNIIGEVRSPLFGFHHARAA